MFWRFFSVCTLTVLLSNCSNDELQPKYSLNISVEGNGTVNPNEGEFSRGEKVTLTAIPEDGYLFEGWSGQVISYDNPLTITMEGNKTLKATFSNFIVNADGVSGKLSDIDNNVYTVVKIGNQWWMAENLRTTKLNDGTNIQRVTLNDVWQNLKTPGYCWYDNNALSYKVPFGAFYNWYTVETGKLCPQGWHVPTNDDWYILINYLGGYQVAGGKLKSTSLRYPWYSPNTGATNESGFSAVPSASRLSDGEFGPLGIYAIWWNSIRIIDSAIAYGVDYDDADVYLGDIDFENGLSCRCIKD
jgi:uncharacterized protein (TIGR02145 family)